MSTVPANAELIRKVVLTDPTTGDVATLRWQHSHWSRKNACAWIEQVTMGPTGGGRRATVTPYGRGAFGELGRDFAALVGQFEDAGWTGRVAYPLPSDLSVLTAQYA